jgi:hypothetical protein
MEWSNNDTRCAKLLFDFERSVVLGINMNIIGKLKITLLMPLLIISTSACAASEKVLVNNSQIILNVKTCTVNFNENESKLLLENDCYFVRNSNSNSIRAEYYSDIKSHVLLIVGSTVKNDPSFPITETRNDCGSQLQGLIISDIETMRLSKVMPSSITCAGIGVDEKDYWIIGHQ